MAETFTLYKLIVLYMLDQVSFPLTTSQISEFILEQGYTSYFTLQKALSELVDSGLLVTESTHNRTLYHLTDDGKDAIHYFRNRISEELKNDIQLYLREKLLELKEDSSAKVDFWQKPNGEYQVRCRITEEGTDLIDLMLAIPTKQEASFIAGTWIQKSKEIYALLLSQLL